MHIARAIFLLVTTITVCVPVKAAEITQIQINKDRIDYNIHDLVLDKFLNQEVFIPPKLFKIWRTLQNNLKFEVGGGIDFNFLREVERVKLSYGNSNKVTFLPDFEVAWHMHPTENAKGKLKDLSPPSPADIQIAIIGNYNLWLMLSNKIAPDFNNTLMLKSYSEEINRPVVVELNIVGDRAGVYTYRAVEQDWLDIWKQQDLNIIRSKIIKIGALLQQTIDEYFIKVINNELSILEARKQIINKYQEIAKIKVVFIEWDELIENGLNLKLDIVELIKHQRTRASD